MEKCFHRACDIPSSLSEPEKSFKFLKEITDAVIKSVFEMTSEADCVIEKEVFKDDFEDKLPNEIDTETQPKVEPVELPDKNPEMAQKSVQQITERLDNLPQIQNYKPNFGGTQINIENLNVNNYLSDKKEEKSQDNDVLFLMDRYSKLDSIWNKYFDLKDKNPKNSPMLIKFVNSEL